MAVSAAPRLPLLPLLLVLAAGSLPGALADGEMVQSPRYSVTPEGGSVSITCSTYEPLLAVYLRQCSTPKPRNVIYYDGENKPTVDPGFEVRVVFSGSKSNLTIAIRDLRVADMGDYYCEGIVEEGIEEEGIEEKGNVLGSGTLVVVTDTLHQAPSPCPETRLLSVALPGALALGFLLLLLGFGAMCVLRRTQIKKLCWARDERPMCVIYEDMSCSCQNPISMANPYQ